MNRVSFTAAAVLCMMLAASAVRSQEVAQRTLPGVVLRDVAVLAVDARGDKLNDQTLFRSTLPDFVLHWREQAEEAVQLAPSPVGLITLSGPPEVEIDVLLEIPEGRFLAGWPPSGSRGNRQLWERVVPAAEATASSPLPADHWLGPLREADRSWVTAGRRTERFLLYDVEIPHRASLKLKWENDAYKLENTGDSALHDVWLYKPLESGVWRTAHVEQLGAGAAPPEKSGGGDSPPGRGSAPQASTGGKVIESIFEDAPVEPAGDQSRQPTEPAAAETRERIAPTAVVTPGQQRVEDPKVLLAPWGERLAELGLGAPEITHVLAILHAQLLARGHATVVYRLDPSELERLLRLDVTPAPERMIRVALVVLVNADPELESVVSELIARLGHLEWRHREAAHARLRELGKAAEAGLRKAVDSDDAEIVHRAEQLLEALENVP